MAGSALTLGRTGELRAARILNRSLIEYAFRLHHYVRTPKDAERDYKRIDLFARRLMRATGDYRGAMSKEQFKAYRRFATAAQEDIPRSQLHQMMRSTLMNFGFSGRGDVKRAMRGVEIEYAVGSAIAHGSEGAIFDVIPIDPERPGFSRHCLSSERFTPAESLARTTLALIVFLRAMEQHHDAEMGAGMHLRSLKLRMGEQPKYSFFTYVAYGPSWP